MSNVSTMPVPCQFTAKLLGDALGTDMTRLAPSARHSRLRKLRHHPKARYDMTSSASPLRCSPWIFRGGARVAFFYDGRRTAICPSRGERHPAFQYHQPACANVRGKMANLLAGFSPFDSIRGEGFLRRRFNGYLDPLLAVPIYSGFFLKSFVLIIIDATC